MELQYKLRVTVKTYLSLNSRKIHKLSAFQLDPRFLTLSLNGMKTLQNTNILFLITN